VGESNPPKFGFADQRPAVEPTSQSRKIVFYSVSYYIIYYMQPKYSKSQFDQAKQNDPLPLQCYICKKIFSKTKKEISQVIHKTNRSFVCKYCSRQCFYKSMITKITLSCKHCGTKFQKTPNQFKKTKNHFCSRSCSTTFHNTHKTQGCRRSKLEIWLEEQLTKIYPSLDIRFNETSAINSELDIYIPQLQVAFELNGIFHYEPIYGPKKLKQIQNNDDRKFQACLEMNIELCVIDSSIFKNFKPHKAQKFLDIITSIVDSKL
jgi:hypothetical protein